MIIRTEHERLTVKVPETLARLLGVNPNEVKVRTDDPSEVDFVIQAAGKTFLVEFKKTTSAAPMAAAVKEIQAQAERFRRQVVPLIAVPFMGEVGRRACEENGVSWLDLSGNAHIVSGGLRIHIEGRSNRFLSAGRPLNLFAPKSSRVVRWLLINPDKPFTQHEIARATKMDEGLVSRVVKRLLAEGLVVRDSNYAVKPRDPSLLLKSWLERYQFWRHTVYQGHAAARSGDALLNFVSDTLTAEGIGHAATGLAAAWVFTRFAAFRVVTIYLENEPSPDLKERLDFREESRGSNLWLVVPNDEGVFHGAMEKDGIRCAHPVQVCLDLKEHPERSAEAADKLRGELFRRGLSGKIPAASAIGDPALRISEKLGRPLRVIDMGKNK